jgi:hypothetical protein
MPTITLTFAPTTAVSAAVIALAAECSADGRRFRTRNGTMYTASAPIHWPTSVTVDESL